MTRFQRTIGACFSMTAATLLLSGLAVQMIWFWTNQKSGEWKVADWSGSLRQAADCCPSGIEMNSSTLSTSSTSATPGYLNASSHLSTAIPKVTSNTSINSSLPNMSTTQTPVVVTQTPQCKSSTNMTDCIAMGTSDAAWHFDAPRRLAAACRQKRTKLLLVFVPVAPRMSAQRDIVRQTWGSGFEHLTFLVQLPAGQRMGAGLSKEVSMFGDIFVVRGPALADSYRCLSVKVLAFLRWLRSACSLTFRYILKSDHDSYWHAASLTRLLRSRIETGQLNIGTKTVQLPGSAEILGSIQNSAAVHRSADSQFCTPVEAYRPDHYPTYASGGPGYLLSRDAAAVLVDTAERLQQSKLAATPFWLEDVYITGMLAEAAVNVTGRAVKHVHSRNIHYAPYTAVTAVATHPPLGMHGLTGEQLRNIHCLMQWPEVEERAKSTHKFAT